MLEKRGRLARWAKADYENYERRELKIELWNDVQTLKEDKRYGNT